MVYIVANSKHAKDLIKLDFPDRLCASPESCENWLAHCKKYNMKFLKGSYGTVVHKDFNEYFKNSKSDKIRKELSCEDILIDGEKISLPLDHTNLLKSKIDNNVYILTSSPYYELNLDLIESIKNYPHDVYVINPNFLDYYSFIDEPSEKLRHPLDGINYAFTNASETQIKSINDAIYNGTGLFGVFRKLL